MSRDQKFLIYHTTPRVAMVLPLDPKGPARPLLDVKAQVSDAEISPSGQWIAYESTESGGRFEVYVRPFPGVDAGRWQISSNGGAHPLWSRDGRELFFIAGDGKMMSVPIRSGPTFEHGSPIALFSASTYFANVARNYDVSPDAKRFVMVKNAASTINPPIVVVTNWFDEVRARTGKN
jgi:dipeptidyl aminopeptidase/acylaminoacyl peptidase